MINRFGFGRNIESNSIIPSILIDPPPVPNPQENQNPIIIPPFPQVEYILSDFGENVINNHFSGDDSWHSERCQFIFNYVTRAFRERCTSYQSYKTDVLGDTLISSNNVLQ